MGHYVVTGTSGFIGSAVAHGLLKEGHNVTGIDWANDSSCSAYTSQQLDCQLLINSRQQMIVNGVQSGMYKSIGADLRLGSMNTLAMKMFIDNIFGCGTGIDAIIHLAGSTGVRKTQTSPFFHVQNNTSCMMSIMDIANRYKIPIIYASSSSVYGRNGRDGCAEQTQLPDPINHYAFSKIQVEQCASQFPLTAPIMGIRLFSVYGEYGRLDMLPMIACNAIARQKCMQVSDAHRDWTYIGDVVDVIKYMLLRIDPIDWPSTLNVGAGNPVSNFRMIETIGEVFGDMCEMLPWSDTTDWEAQVTCANNTLLKSMMPTTFEFTDISVGVEKFVTWHRDYDRRLSIRKEKYEQHRVA